MGAVMGRKPLLPDNAQLMKLESAGLSHEQIAEKYGVSRQAVTKRFNDMGEYSQRPLQDVTAALPWDIASYPSKDKLKHSRAFLGLRAFLRERMGFEVSAERSREALRVFLDHVQAGEVLELHPGEGARYVSRRKSDGSLVIRWPDDVPEDARTDLFRLPPGQGLAGL
ncbi:hypothetical protein [Streptomyces bluensis]|uniref:hypothetical protein n=1 Tax=Streptomyces bluensis TaxID=33897 RepID=UPI00331E5C14